MSSFYGVPEAEEVFTSRFKPTQPPVTEPVDDENLYVAKKMPERDFVQSQDFCRFKLKLRKEDCPLCGNERVVLDTEAAQRLAVA